MTQRQPPILDREIQTATYRRTQLGGQFIYDLDPNADETSVWAARRLVSVDDQIHFASGDGGPLFLTDDIIYRVRFDDADLFPVASLLTRLRDDDGAIRLVVGKVPVGRRRYVDILCRS